LFDRKRPFLSLDLIPGPAPSATLAEGHRRRRRASEVDGGEHGARLRENAEQRIAALEAALRIVAEAIRSHL
jgi:hypothetical protein